jgi:hypothetical protein
MTHAHVDELRRKLISNTDFADIWDYFLTHFGEQPEFIRRGKRGTTEELARCIAECYGRAKPELKAVAVRDFRPKEVDEFKMVHGVCVVDGHWCGFVYFMDLDMGLVCFSNLTTGQSIMGRFHADPNVMKNKSMSPTGVQ